MAPRGAHRDRHNRRGHNTIVLHSCRKPVLGVCVPARPRKVVAVSLPLEYSRSTEREAGHSLRFSTGGAEALEPPPPKSLAMGSGLGSASGGASSTSTGSSSPRRTGAEGTTPLRASSPPPVVVTDTICIPGASAAAPEFLPSPRPLADPVTTCRGAGWGVREAGWKH